VSPGHLSSDNNEYFRRNSFLDGTLSSQERVDSTRKTLKKEKKDCVLHGDRLQQVHSLRKVLQTA